MKLNIFSKWTFVGVAALALAAGAFTNRLTARAQDMAPQTFIVQAGDQGPVNIDLIAFAPANLQVHRGDTVTWTINSFHNVHFAEAISPLVIAPEVDGQPLPQINPAVAFRTLDTGAAYQGGDANSGIPLAPEDTVYSLIMDVEPGNYSYFCDIHPGMVGVVTVVTDDVAIPSPEEVSLQGIMELRSAIAAGTAAALELEARPAERGQVQAGSSGVASINQFFPAVAEISVGESVTFTIPADSLDPHTVSAPPVRGQDVVPQPVEGGPPMLLLGPTIAPMTPSGASVSVGDAYSSGIFEPGNSFTLTFNEPGVYSYVCNIHPGMDGVIVVTD